MDILCLIMVTVCIGIVAVAYALATLLLTAED